KRGTTTLQSIGGQPSGEEKSDQSSDDQSSEMEKNSKNNSDLSGEEKSDENSNENSSEEKKDGESHGDESSREEQSEESESEQSDEKEEEGIESSPNYVKIISNDKYKFKTHLRCNAGLMIQESMRELVLELNLLKKKIETHWLKMASKKSVFNSYPWGRVSFDLTISYLLKELDSTKSQYNLHGCQWAFAAWAFEAIRHFNDWRGFFTEKSIPRMIKWMVWNTLTRQILILFIRQKNK
ncbi:hypothetical protein H5410_012415, partial [Solanum commersonii]